MTEQQIISLADRATDFETMLKDKLPPEIVQAASQAIASSKATATSFAANGSVASLVLYMKCQCIISGGKTFDGESWGVAFPGGGALIGDVYLANGNDLNSLYANTSAFTMTATPVYTAFYFKNSGGTLLGHFQAGSISTVTGTGGGSGKWS